MTSFQPHASQDDDRNSKDALDDALERLVHGVRRGIDGLDSDMRARVDQMYRWADQSDFRSTPLPATRPRAWGAARWVSQLSGVAAAAILVGIIAFGTFLIVDMSRDDPAPDSSYGSGGGDMVDADRDDYITMGEYAQAIKVAYEDYRWPDAYTPTVEDIVNSVSRAEDREESTAEYPYGPEPGHRTVGIWHSCAWYRAWIDAYQSGDSELEEEALDMITNVVPDHFDFDENTHERSEEAARRASLGDPSRVSEFLEGCGDLPLVHDAEDNGGTSENEQWRAWIDGLDLRDDGNCFDVGPSGQMVPCYPGTPPAPPN